VSVFPCPCLCVFLDVVDVILSKIPNTTFKVQNPINKMAENCPKCKKSINSKDAIIICNSDDCLKKFHRTCVNIDDAMYDLIQKNPMISFNCDECRNQSPKALSAKLHTIEEKVNKVCNGVNQIQGRIIVMKLRTWHLAGGAA